jgi:hypothetical protein
MSTMSPTRYRSICRHARGWLDAPLPHAIPVDEVASISSGTGVYVVCEPLERVQYVGSVARPGRPGIYLRLREHLREGHKRLNWKSVWIVPLVPETPVPVVRLIEACIGAELDPLGQGRLPRL